MERTVREDPSAMRIFEDCSVARAVGSMVMPTIISQLILVVYNLADTWYVGRTGNADAVAAISLCLPVYTILSALSNLFGIGGAAVIARALGTDDKRKAKTAFMLATYGALACGAVYCALIFVFSRPLLMLIGADAGDIDYALEYIKWTTVIGGVPTVLAPTFAHMVRARGNPRAASAGMITGALLNIALDPLFMFVLLEPGHEVEGAAIATAVANTVSLGWFVVFMSRRRAGDESAPGAAGEVDRRGVIREILRSGIPSFCMQALAMFSNCFLNSMLAVMGGEAVAGIGIVRKIDQLAFAVNQGITQGMLPLVAYCYASGRRKRMKQVIAFCAVITFAFSLVCACISLIFAPRLVRLFINDSASIAYGSAFLRVICLSIPIYSLTFIIITVFQAVGCAIQPFVLSLLHKGSLDIILMFILRATEGVSQITLASPISDMAALSVGLIMLVKFLKGAAPHDGEDMAMPDAKKSAAAG